MGSGWPESQVNLQQSPPTPHPVLFLPLQAGSDLPEKPSLESTGVWPRRTLSDEATLAQGEEGTPLVSPALVVLCS